MPAPARAFRPFRFLLFACGAVVVLAVAGWVVMASALNPQRLSDELQEAVRRSTGRDLTIAGGVHLRVGLSPDFVVDDIALANIDGGSRPQMLTAKSLHASLALFPLLSGNAVISALTVEQPDILLERGPDGTGNWQFAPSKKALFQPKGGQGGSTGTHHSVEIRHITLRGGQLTWRGANADPISIGIKQLDVVADNADAPLTLAVDGAYRSLPFTLKASSGSLQRLMGGPVSALAGPWPLTADLASQNSTLHVEGGIAHPEQLRGYQFRVSTHIADLSAWNPLLSSPTLPPLLDVNGAAMLADGSQGDVRTSQLSLHAGISDLSRVAAGLVIKTATFTAPGPGQLVQLAVEGTYDDQPLRIAGNATQPDILALTAPVPVTLTGQAASATLSAHGTIPPALTMTGLDLQVSARAPDLSALSPLVGRTLPAAHDFALDARIGDAGVKLRGIAVRDLTLASSLGDLAGNFTLIWTPRMSLQGALTSQTMNVDGLDPNANADLTLPNVWPPPAVSGAQIAMPPAAPAPGAVPVVPPPAATPAPGLGIPLVFLRNNDADLALTVGDLVVGGQHYHDLDAHLLLQDGKLALNPFRAVAPEGAIIGGASIDATSDMPPIAITLRSPSISAAAIATAFGSPGGATGTMQVDAQLSGTGQTVSELEASLDGHLGLAMVNGQVDNGLIQGLIGDALNQAGVPSVGAGNSQVKCFALRVNFAAGIGTVQSLAVDLSRLSIDGDGSIDLGHATADMHLRPQIRLGPTSVSAPVSLQGPFGQLKATLDPVMGNGRVGMSIGGDTSGPSVCATKLATARGGLNGPMPAIVAAPAGDLPFVIKKPKDLLKGLFH